VNLSSTELVPIVLGLLVAISLIATVVQRSRRHKIRHEIRSLATEWGMTYASQDRLRLARKIYNRLPVVGAASLTVCDVIYGAKAGERRCVFTVQFTTGVIRVNKRVQRVGLLVESLNARAASNIAFDLAPEELPLIEQYRALDPRAAQKDSSASVDAELSGN
jgi:hypothetical protein